MSNQNGSVTTRHLLSHLFVAIVGLVVGTLIGFMLFGGPDQADRKVQSYPLELAANPTHAHEVREVGEDTPAPSVDIEVMPDPGKERQYMVRIRTQNFRFAPDKISADPVPGEGHGHVYVDDVMISRALSGWYHIPKLEPGRHTVLVTLNWNDHKEYAVNGESVSATQTIEVPEPEE